MPYEGGEAVLRAALADFGELNARLTEGGFFGARRFQIKRGDLTVGDELRARNVELVVDGGSLTVNGRIDASGPQVGSIRLAAMGDLVINGVLDAHSTTLRVDSYKIIDSANRAIVDLTSRTGKLSLGAGAQVDLRAGVGAQNNDGVARGTLDLNARRLGGGSERRDRRLRQRRQRRGRVGRGRSADPGRQDGGGERLPPLRRRAAGRRSGRHRQAPAEITQGYLDGIDGQNQIERRAGQPGGGRAPGRPGRVQAASGRGSRQRHAGRRPDRVRRHRPVQLPLRAGRRPAHARARLCEPGVLVLRAGGNLNIYGSINDGFGPPPESPDDAGWQLVQGRLGSQGITAFGGDLVVPIGGVKLEAGTMFPTGSKLNYDLPVAPVTLPAGTVLPVAMTLDAALSLPAGLVLTGDVTAADGRVLRAGTVLAGELKLAPGAQLGAGFVLRGEAAVRAFTWPRACRCRPT